MKEKKNIDNIFKEGFKNLEATPSPRVWENIQAELNKEKKVRKVIPLWIKLGGVAALLALMFTIGSSVYNSSNTIVAPQLTNENIEQQLQENKTRSGIENEVNETQVASEDKTLQGRDANSSEENSFKNSNKENTSEKSFKNSSNQPANSVQKASNAVIASGNSEENSSKSEKSKATSQKDLLEKNASEKSIKEGVATSNKTSDLVEKSNTSKNAKETHQTISDTEKDVLKQSKEGIANTKAENKNSEIISATKKETIAKAEKELEKDSKNKKSIFDEIAKKDEVALAEKKKNEKPDNRWSVAPNVAPVYYSSFGNGSSIDPTFTDNPQKGDVNMSYGVQVSYAVSNRLSVRAGVNNVDLSYSTADIIVGTRPVSEALQSVDYGGRQIVTTAVPKHTFNNSTSSGNFDDLTPKSTQGEARLIQNINYYEVPVELKYSILDTKLGVNVIGGISTLFLGNNEISVKADNFNTILGEANNLTDISFSTNVGLGLDYKLSKKFTFNIEPMFKYQLNPYTDSSVNFKPYYLGVYSGLSFKF